MNTIITLTGTNQVVELTTACRVVWIEPIAGIGSVDVSVATPRAEGQSTFKWHSALTLDLANDLPNRIMPDFFPCGAVRLNGPAGEQVKVIGGEPIIMSPRIV